MLQSHPIEEPHLDFSSWREHFNNNSNNNDAPSSSRHALDLPTSWTQTFDQSLLRLDNVSNNRFSLIDRVMNDNNTQRSIPQQSILSQPELLPPQLPPFDNNFQQTSSSSSSSSHNSEEQNDQDIESVWEQSSQQQDINTLKPLTWDDHIQPTPFLTELPLLVSEQLFQNQQPSAYNTNNSMNSINIPVVKEQPLVESLIQTLLGNPSICFKWNDSINAFEPRISQLRILGVSITAMQPVIERYLVFGTHMKKLEYLVDICKGNPKRYGLTGIAFACCLECLHLQIQHSLSTVFSQGEWTLLQVYHHISTLADTLNRIARLVHLDGGVIDNASSEAIQEIRKVGFYIPKGSQLLEMIWNEIIPLDFAVTGATAFYRDLCLGILCHTSIPYLTMLSEWLGLSNKSLITDPAFTDWHDLVDESPIRDPYQEFFLCDIHRTKESLVDRFQPRKEKELPYFLNPMQAGVILRTGNALQLLRRFQPEHPLCCIENISNDFMLHWMPLEAQSHRYIEKLHAFTRLVRQYNENNDSNGRLLVDHDESSMDIEMNQEEEQEDGEETNIQVPTLQALDQDIKLVGDFHKTLDTILLCHQQQQQQDSNNDSDDFLHDHSFIPVVQTITDQSVHQPLALWCPLVNESAMKLFIEKFHIQAHFELIRRFFLFGDDRFSNALAEALFINNNHKRQEQQGAIFVGGIRLHDGGRNSNRMMVKQWPPQTSDLNMSLRAVLLENLAQIPEDIKGYICKPHHPLLDQSLVDLDDLLTFGVREIDPLQQDDRPRWRDPYKIEALDFLYLQYQVPYPLSIIINERTLDKYNRMFTFLLQLQRIDSITKYIHQKLLLQQQPKRSKPPSFFYLQHRIRFQIRQFVNTLNQYVFDTAIHHTWHSFIQRIQHQKKKKENHSQQGEEDYDKEEDEASLFQTMDPIMFGEYHEHVLDRMLYQCFLKKSQQPIKHMLNQVLQDIITLSTTFIFLLDHHYVSTNSTMEECEKQLEQGFQHFMEHTHQFIKVLSKLHDRGIGRLGNVMNSKNLEGSFGVFGDFHDKLDAKRGQGTFAQELLTRLDMNGYYMNYSSSSTTTATTSTTTTPTATSISS